MQKINQETLFMKHYFRVQPLKCIIISGDLNNFFTTKTDEASDFNNHVIKGDPIIFGTIIENNDVKINGGNIISINENDMHLIISPDKSFKIPEKREYERYPVSILGYIKPQKENQKGYYIYVKDMSYSGIRVYSTAELEVKDNVRIDLYLQDNVLNFDGVVIRKAISYGRNEYGIHFIFTTKESMYSIRSYLDRLVNIEKKLFIKHLLK